MILSTIRFAWFNGIMDTRVLLKGPHMDNSNKKSIIINALLILLGLGLVIGLGVWIVSQGEESRTPENVTQETPVTATPNSTSAISYGQDDEGNLRVLTPAEAKTKTTVIDVYLDYSCPSCAGWEIMGVGSVLADLAKDDKGFVTNFHIMNFLNKANNKYSSRAATASLVVAEKAPEKWLAYNQSLFLNQNPNTTNEGLAKLAGENDIELTSEEIHTRYFTWLDDNTKTAFTKVEGTPTTFLNGEEVEYSTTQDAGAFSAFYTDKIGK